MLGLERVLLGPSPSTKFLSLALAVPAVADRDAHLAMMLLVLPLAREDAQDASKHCCKPGDSDNQVMGVKSWTLVCIRIVPHTECVVEHESTCSAD